MQKPKAEQCGAVACGQCSGPWRRTDDFRVKKRTTNLHKLDRQYRTDRDKKTDNGEDGNFSPAFPPTS